MTSRPCVPAQALIPRVLTVLVLALAFLVTPSAAADPTMELPAISPDAHVYTYPGYTLQYNERFEQADWVAYELTADEVYGNAATRTNKFLPDPSIQTGSATSEDYAKSGYDRGHLAPAADMKFSEEAMRDCFFYSNMSPQVPAFNRGTWGDLEEMVRYWAVTNGSVYVVTGPALDKQNYPRIGPHKVAVSERFFKVILDYREPQIKAIAFILKNSAETQKIEAAECSVDEAELITGLDFFPNIPDPEEQKIESSFDPKLWPLIRFSLQKFPRSSSTAP
jgi:endonuclease G